MWGTEYNLLTEFNTMLLLSVPPANFTDQYWSKLPSKILRKSVHDLNFWQDCEKIITGLQLNSSTLPRKIEKNVPTNRHIWLLHSGLKSCNICTTLHDYKIVKEIWQLKLTGCESDLLFTTIDQFSNSVTWNWDQLGCLKFRNIDWNKDMHRHDQHLKHQPQQ